MNSKSNDISHSQAEQRGKVIVPVLRCILDQLHAWRDLQALGNLPKLKGLERILIPQRFPKGI